LTGRDETEHFSGDLGLGELEGNEVPPTNASASSKDRNFLNLAPTKFLTCCSHSSLLSFKQGPRHFFCGDSPRREYARIPPFVDGIEGFADFWHPHDDARDSANLNAEWTQFLPMVTHSGWFERVITTKQNPETLFDTKAHSASI
jgi:hypothetical protein